MQIDTVRAVFLLPAADDELVVFHADGKIVFGKTRNSEGNAQAVFAGLFDVVRRIAFSRGFVDAVVARCDTASAEAILRRMSDAAEKLNRGGKPYAIAYSVGMASADQFPEDSFEALVTRADALMYQQKRLRRTSRTPQSNANGGPPK